MVVISFISAIGLGLGKVRLMGISLGVTFVFFVGILAGHLGFTVDPAMRPRHFRLRPRATGRPGLLQLVSYGRIDA